jgi:hypothetical protein
VLPARYCDIPPEPLTQVEVKGTVDDEPQMEDEPRAPRSIRLIVRDTCSTLPNVFGLWRKFLHWPSHNPDLNGDPFDIPPARTQHTDALITPANPLPEPPGAPLPAQNLNPFWPWSNMSKALFMSWFNSGNSTKKSAEEVDTLVNNVLDHPQFRFDDLVDRQLKVKFSVCHKNARADKVMASESESPSDNAHPCHEHFEQGVFRKSLVQIEVPLGQRGRDNLKVDIRPRRPPRPD